HKCQEYIKKKTPESQKGPPPPSLFRKTKIAFAGRDRVLGAPRPEPLQLPQAEALDNDYLGFLRVSGLPICGLATSMPLLCDSEASFFLIARQQVQPKLCTVVRPVTLFPCEMARPGAVFWRPPVTLR